MKLKRGFPNLLQSSKARSHLSSACMPLRNVFVSRSNSSKTSQEVEIFEIIIAKEETQNWYEDQQKSRDTILFLTVVPGIFYFWFSIQRILCLDPQRKFCGSKSNFSKTSRQEEIFESQKLKNAWNDCKEQDEYVEIFADLDTSSDFFLLQKSGCERGLSSETGKN